MSRTCIRHVSDMYQTYIRRVSDMHDWVFITHLHHSSHILTILFHVSPTYFMYNSTEWFYWMVSGSGVTSLDSACWPSFDMSSSLFSQCNTAIVYSWQWSTYFTFSHLTLLWLSSSVVHLCCSSLHFTSIVYCVLFVSMYHLMLYLH